MVLFSAFESNASFMFHVFFSELKAKKFKYGFIFEVLLKRFFYKITLPVGMLCFVKKMVVVSFPIPAIKHYSL